MSKQYIFYQGKVREVHAQFENYILYKAGNDIKGTNPHGIEFCDAAGNVLSEDLQQELKGEKVVQAAAQISLNNEKSNVVKVKVGNNNALFSRARAKISSENATLTNEENFLESGGKLTEENPAPETYNLNHVNTDEEIRAVAQAVPGLGFKTLRIIVENRPADGYVDLDHLRTENAHAIPKNLKWTSMEKYLEF